MKQMPVTVASLNIRGFPLAGSRLAARCQAIGAFFEASDADVVCFQEVLTYYHLRQLARHLPSFREVSCQRTPLGPAGDVVTFSRLAVAATAYHGFGAAPAAPGIPLLTRLDARMKGALVTRLAVPAVTVVNTHPVANKDGDWSPANRFAPVHRAELAALARTVRGIPAPAVACGDFNVARDSALFAEFIAGTGLVDAFDGNCQPTFRAEFLPAGATRHCIDFILTTGDVNAEAAEVLFAGKQEMRGGAGFVSDHVGLLARLNCPAA
jgi:endonuclease/exonuclease/phosphatase family metal-dependent hydrolase